jgi:hypothetical protein
VRIRFFAPKIGRENVSVQGGVAKCSGGAWVAASEVVGGESGEFR